LLLLLCLNSSSYEHKPKWHQSRCCCGWCMHGFIYLEALT
jgi:hypothetical protein